jgi:hypothetical protein
MWRIVLGACIFLVFCPVLQLRNEDFYPEI